MMLALLAVLAPRRAAGLGDFTVSNLFADSMVLQRAPAVATLTGAGRAGATVHVSVASAAGVTNASSAPAPASGDWSVALPPLRAGSYTLTFASSHGGQFAVLRDVLAGEVFLCAGQSNMEFTLAGVFNATAECSEDAFADLEGLRLMRLGYVQKEAPQPQLPAEAFAQPGFRWSRATPRNTCGDGTQRGIGFSAACFAFARELHRTLRVPVGAVDSSWGGTNIENWMSREASAPDDAPRARSPPVAQPGPGACVRTRGRPPCPPTPTPHRARANARSRPLARQWPLARTRRARAAGPR